MTISVVPTEHDAWGSKKAKAIESCGRFESFMAAAELERDAACEKRDCVERQRSFATSALYQMNRL